MFSSISAGIRSAHYFALLAVGPCFAPSVPVGVRPRRIPANGDLTFA
jgi:hypothetical protein